jgi:hypothetical protein
MKEREEWLREEREGGREAARKETIEYLTLLTFIR